MAASLAHIIHRLTTDAQFHARFQASPVETVGSCGLVLSHQEMKVLVEMLDLVSHVDSRSSDDNTTDSTSGWIGGASFTHSALTRPA